MPITKDAYRALRQTSRSLRKTASHEITATGCNLPSRGQQRWAATATRTTVGEQHEDSSAWRPPAPVDEGYRVQRLHSEDRVNIRFHGVSHLEIHKSSGTVDSVAKVSNPTPVLRPTEPVFVAEKHSSAPVMKKHVTTMKKYSGRPITLRIAEKETPKEQSYHEKRLELSQDPKQALAAKGRRSQRRAKTTTSGLLVQKAVPLVRQLPTAENLVRIHMSKSIYLSRRMKAQRHHHAEMKHNFPQLDSFLDDFHAILRMLRNATPKVEARAEEGIMDLDSEYWTGGGPADGTNLGSLRDIVDDIVYAPRHEALRMRALLGDSRRSLPTQSLPSRPKQWTEGSLELHIRHLVRFEGGSINENGNEEVPRIQTAIKEIVSVLNDEKARPYLTSSVLNVAIDHLSRHKHFTYALQIFHHLRSKSFPFNSLDFSRFLFAAAWQAKSKNFRPVLEHMLEKGVKPRGNTWFTFYQLINRKYPAKRKRVLKAMRARGLMGAGDKVKEALVRSLGWIDKSELMTDPQVKPKLFGQSQYGKIEDGDKLKEPMLIVTKASTKD